MKRKKQHPRPQQSPFRSRAATSVRYVIWTPFLMLLLLFYSKVPLPFKLRSCPCALCSGGAAALEGSAAECANGGGGRVATARPHELLVCVARRSARTRCARSRHREPRLARHSRLQRVVTMYWMPSF